MELGEWLQCMQIADAQPRMTAGESPQRADGHSSAGFGAPVLGGLGEAASWGIPRRASFASSDQFGGLTSMGSVAASEDDLAPSRAALPPLSTLPRISREGALFACHVPQRRMHLCAGIRASVSFII